MEGVVHRADNIRELDDLVRSLSTDGFRIVSVLDRIAGSGSYVIVAQRELPPAEHEHDPELDDRGLRQLERGFEMLPHANPVRWRP